MPVAVKTVIEKTLHNSGICQAGLDNKTGAALNVGWVLLFLYSKGCESPFFALKSKDSEKG